MRSSCESMGSVLMAGVSEEVRIKLAARIIRQLAGLPDPMARRWVGDYPARDAEASEDDDSEDDPYPHRDAAGEIEENSLNVHRDSVNLIGRMRNVTLVSRVVRACTVKRLMSSEPIRGTAQCRDCDPPEPKPALNGPAVSSCAGRELDGQRSSKPPGGIVRFRAIVI